MYIYNSIFISVYIYVGFSRDCRLELLYDEQLQSEHFAFKHQLYREVQSKKSTEQLRQKKSWTVYCTLARQTQKLLLGLDSPNRCSIWTERWKSSNAVRAT